MKKNIYIVGGGGFAREIYLILLMMIEKDSSLSFGGFFGHAGFGASDNYKNLHYLYKGEESKFNFGDNDFAVIGTGYPATRRRIYNDLKKKDVKFFTIHVGKPFNESVIVGEANIFIPPFNPTNNVTIGDGNVFNYDIGIGHDVQIGDFNFFGPRSNVLGCGKIGNDNIIGANAICLPNSKIGNNNKIAPLSAVYKGCKNNCYMIGNPALKAGVVQ